MTISTSSSSTTVAGTGALSLFQFSFVYYSAASIVVIYTDATGTETTLSPSQYTLTLNPPAINQLWGIGGTVLYPLVGSPIAAGTSLTISRVLSLTQETTVRNQGNYYAQVTEEALDTLEMQIQQLENEIEGGSGTSAAPAVFICGTVAGSANTLTVANTYPTDFALNQGILVTFTPTSNNTNSATLNIKNTGNVVIQKNTYSGPANLVKGDLFAGLPVIAQYTGTTYLGLNIVPVNYEKSVSTAQAVGFGQNLNNYVATGPFSATIASTATLLSYWYTDFFAQNGAIAFVIDAADRVNAGSLGVGVTMPRGASGRLTTDGAGNLYLSGLNSTFTPKFYLRTNQTGTTYSIVTSYNVASINRVSTGVVDVTLSSPYTATTAAVPSVTTDDVSVNGAATVISTSVIRVSTGNPTADDQPFYVIGFGV